MVVDDKLPPTTLYTEYRRALVAGMRAAPGYTAEINVLMHAFGHLKDQVSDDEKAFFHRELDMYRRGITQIAGLKILLRAWILRGSAPVLAEQTWFAPYPDPLMVLPPDEIDRGRDMWRGDLR